MGLLSNIVHGVFDVAGFIPGVGAVADLANAAIYAAEGDWGNAAMSAVSAIPGIGDTMALASKGAKVAKGLKGLSALGKGKTLLKGMKGKLFKSLKGLAKDGASFLKKLNPKKLFKGIKKEKKKVCVSGKCFTEDTLVCTPDEYVMIRDIKEGDFVCSRDELTGKTGYKRVTSISRTKAHTVYTVKIDGNNGNTEIKATAYHPFYVEERGWVNVINLLEGDRLVTEKGTSIITSISKERHEEPVTMYNFHVEDWVSYFVSELKVYVHNGGKHPKKVSKVNGKGGKVFDSKAKQWTATNPKGSRQTYEVHQRNDIDWDKVRTSGNKDFIGKTNAEAAQRRGLAPQLDDGNFATLHHLGQDSRGGLAEASTRYHGVGKPGQDILHSQYGRNKPNPNYPINRGQFAYDTKEYWKWREQNR